MSAFIRVLYGTQETRPRVRHTVLEALKQSDWARDEVHHYVAGPGNAKLLRDLGCRRIHLVNDNEIVSGGCSHWYSKTWLLRAAMRDHQEVCATDFDCLPVSPITGRVWELLRSRGTLQCPVIQYKRCQSLQLVEHTKGGRFGKVLSGCFVYCRDVSFVDRWLAAWHDVTARMPPGPIKDKVNDEPVLMHSFDLAHPRLSLDELIRRFEPRVVLTRRSLRPDKPTDEIFFRHGT